MIRLATVLLSLGFATVCFAAGKGGHGSVTDLIAPLVNVLILGSFLVFKLKGPLRSHFESKSSDIESRMNAAAEKAKEIKLRHSEQKSKLDGLESQIAKIKAEGVAEVEDFQSAMIREIESKKHKLEKDVEGTVSAKQAEIAHLVSEHVLQQVIATAKKSIQGNDSAREKVSGHIVKGI